MLKIALPKGRMGDKVYAMFESIGYPCREIKEDNRKLVFRSDNGEVSYVLVKPSDVTVYVERGAAAALVLCDGGPVEVLELGQLVRDVGDELLDRSLKILGALGGRTTSHGARH